jgi:hypothetical protein
VLFRLTRITLTMAYRTLDFDAAAELRLLHLLSRRIHGLGGITDNLFMHV